MKSVLAMVLILSIAGCERSGDHGMSTSKPAAVSAASRESRLPLVLNAYRQGISRTPASDRDAIGRIDYILSLLPHPSQFEHKGYLFTAAVGDDRDVWGADLFRATCVAGKGVIQEVELLGSNGNQIGVCRNPVVAWDATNERGTIGSCVVAFYIAPSAFDPASHAVSPGVKHGRIDPYEVVTLPPGTDIRKVRVQIVFAGGWKTDSIPIWVYRPKNDVTTQGSRK